LLGAGFNACCLGAATPGGSDEEAEPILDARVLPIKRLSDGTRQRSFKESVAELIESAWDNWPVQGPRTLLWCCRFIAEHSLHPLAHHARFRQVSGAQPLDAGVSEHESSMRLLEHALCYDQLQVCELASLELSIR